MYKGKKVLGLITARGGSKGLPGKNVRHLLGKPLVGWSAEQGRQSRYIDRLVISTDDVEIAETARQFGAEVPFMRPAELALDTSPSIDAILHAVDQLGGVESWDILVLLEPTSPLREALDIDAAIEALCETPSAESIVSVCKVKDSHPAFLVKSEGGFARPYLEQFSVQRRQDLEDLFFFDGTVYASTIEALRRERKFYHSTCLTYEVPSWKSPEIDDLTDFLIVESILKAKQEGLIK